MNTKHATTDMRGTRLAAAWVFFKVRANEGAAWQPVRLAADRVLNPTGYAQDPVSRPAAAASQVELRHFLGQAKSRNEQIECRPDVFSPPGEANVTRLEFLVPDGADGFTGLFMQRVANGAGTVALPADWPQDDAVGTGFRCHGLDNAPASDRLRAADVNPDRVCKFRAVRTAPVQAK
ncbi:MAG: hypothetical protein ACOYOU_06825 [Kiritimatiellia bacterium]